MRVTSLDDKFSADKSNKQLHLIIPVSGFTATASVQFTNTRIFDFHYTRRYRL